MSLGKPPSLPEFKLWLRETGLVFVGLLLVAAVVFGWRIAHGGFASDDWNNYMIYTWEQPGSFWDAVSRSAELNSYRPFLVPYTPATVRIFGENSHAFLAWAVAVACLMSASFFLLLRTLRMDRMHATVLAGLLLVFPLSISTRLWSTASHPALAVATVFLGLSVALQGLRLSGWRAAATHTFAVCLYLLGIWNHELTVPGVLASVFLYRLYVPWKPALKRYAFDLLAVAVTLAFITSNEDNPASPASLAHTITHAFDVGYQALLAIAASMLPFLPSTVAFITAPLLLLGVVIWFRRLPTGDPARAPVIRWATIGGGGLLATAFAYSILAPGPDIEFNEPMALGVGQRTSLLAGVGIVTLVYAAVQAGAALAASGRSWWPRRELVGAIAAALLVGGGYVYRDEQSVATWNRSESIQADVLDEVERALPNPPKGSTVFIGGYPTFSSPYVPAFALYDDLNGAIKAQYGDGSIAGFPIVAPRRPFKTAKAARTKSSRGATRFKCGAESFTANNAYTLGDSYHVAVRKPIPYGKGYFLDVRRGSLLRPTSQPECEAAVAATPPGPLLDSAQPRWPQPVWWSLGLKRDI